MITFEPSEAREHTSKSTSGENGGFPYSVVAWYSVGNQFVGDRTAPHLRGLADEWFLRAVHNNEIARLRPPR